MTKEPLTGAEQASLAARIRAGDHAAEGELIARFERPLLMMMRARTRDAEDARELVQDVLMAVVRAVRGSQIDDEEKLAAFVHGTARNLANNYLRSRRRQPLEDPLPDDIPDTPAPDRFEERQQWSFVRRALAQLSPADRRILLLSLVQGLTPAEIGASLGLTPQFVRTRKSRAVRKVIELVTKLTRPPGQVPLRGQERK